MRESWRRVLRVAAWLAVFVPFAALFALLMAPRAPLERSVGQVTIPPGRETEVMALLDGDARSFAGIPVTNIMIDHDVVLLQLEDTGGPSCVLPRTLRPPGGVVIAPTELQVPGGPVVPAGDLSVSWRTCGLDEAAARADGERLALALKNRPHDRVWNWVEVKTFEDPEHVGGMLGPFFRAIKAKSSNRVLAVILLVGALFAFLAAVVAPAPSNPPTAEAKTAALGRSSSRSRSRGRFVTYGLLVLVFAVGAWLRLRAATDLPLDNDEQWAFPSRASIVADDHDAWVHPPMHRALQQAWTRTIHWREGASLLRLRGISLGASLATLAILCAYVGRKAAPLAAISVLGIALAPAVISASVLARPYALAAIAVVLAGVALFPPRAGPPTRLGWFLAILSVTLAAWTDLVAGIAGIVILVLAVGQSVLKLRLRAVGSAILSLGATMVFCVALVPGAIAARHEQVLPMQADGHAGPDLRPFRGFGHGEVAGLTTGVAKFFIIGADPDNGSLLALVPTLACLIFVTVGARRSRAVALGVVPWALLFACVLVGRYVALRARNILFLPHVIAVFVAGAMTIEIDRRRNAASRDGKSRGQIGEPRPVRGDDRSS